MTFLAGVLATSSPAAAEEVIKIGVLDIAAAMDQSKKGQQAGGQLKGKLEQLQKDFERRRAELQRLRKELSTQGSSVLSWEARREKEKSLLRKERDLEDWYRDAQEDFRRQEYEMTRPVLEGLLETVHRFGKEAGFTLILEKGSGVIYAPEALDITDEVVRRFDSGK
jgi:outer membrane protein